jgi:hypothetical protein
MVDIALTLGDISFQGFEIPSSITLAGKQRLVVHRLLSGSQIVDMLGRDKEVVEWKGTLSGVAASARACDLDRLRLAGAPLLLSWDVYSFQVLIDAFTADYSSPWWIPYSLSCLVIQDLSSPVAEATANPLDLITVDLSVASQYTNVAGFQASIAAGGIIPGSSAYSTSLATGVAAQTTLSGAITTAGSSANTSLENWGSSFPASFLSAVGNCQLIAKQTSGQAYLSRAVVNLSNLEP